MIRLERIDRAANARRYYELRLTRSLFGEVVLVRRWGRIGTPGGRQALEHFESVGAARRAWRLVLRAKRRRGYAPPGARSRSPVGQGGRE